MLPGRGVRPQPTHRVWNEHAGRYQLKHLGQAPKRGGGPHRVVRPPGRRARWKDQRGVCFTLDMSNFILALVLCKRGMSF